MLLCSKEVSAPYLSEIELRSHVYITIRLPSQKSHKFTTTSKFLRSYSCICSIITTEVAAARKIAPILNNKTAVCCPLFNILNNFFTCNRRIFRFLIVFPCVSPQIRKVQFFQNRETRFKSVEIRREQAKNDSSRNAEGKNGFRKAC